MKSNPSLFERKIDSKSAKFVSRALKLSENQYNGIVDAGEIRPSLDVWFGWLDRALLFAATAFLLAGVLCFLSYNWAGLHKFIKFGLLEAGLIVTLAMAWKRGIDLLAGKLLLFASATLIGFCLALFGQVYQTGADPYGLFLGWLIAIAAWTSIGRQAGLYVLFIILANLSLIFYWNQVISPSQVSELVSQLFGPLVRLFVDSGRSYLPLLVLALNIAFIAFFEFLGENKLGTKGQSTVRTAGMAGIIPITSSAVVLLFASGWSAVSGSILTSFLTTTVAGLWYFRFKNRDLLISAAILLALIIFVTSLLIKITDFGTLGVFSFLFIGIAVLIQTGAAAYWLRISNADGEGTQR